MGLRREVKKLVKKAYPEFYARLRCLSRLGYDPDFVNPTTFNEKVNHRKFYCYERGSDFVRCADKLLVRYYVAEKVGSDILIPLVATFDSVDIDALKLLGSDVVIKTTHDSGTVFLANQDGYIDIKTVGKKLKKALKRDYGEEVSEWWYSEITPKIIVEKRLPSSPGSVPEDYKFHVFRREDGYKIILQCDYDRFASHNRSFYDEGGLALDYTSKKPNFGRPCQLEQADLIRMVDIAKKLAANFTYVRVDLYCIDGQIYFGELTFAAGGGFDPFISFEQDKEWGGFWELGS